MVISAVIPPDGEVSKRILDDVQTTQEQLDRDVKTLKYWLQLQPHLPQNVLGDILLASFIIGCKNSLDTTKLKIDTYLSNRSKFPELYANRDFKSEEFLEDEADSQTFLLPRLTPEGYSVVIARLVDPDSDAIKFSTSLRRALIILDIGLATRYQGGFYIIADFKGFTMRLAVKISLKLLNQFLTCLEDGMPVRIKGVFLLNMPSFAERIMKSTVNSAEEDLRNKIHIYPGDYTNLYEYIPKEMLPNEYGGEAGTCEDIQHAFNEFSEGFRNWFLEDANLKVDEFRRPRKSPYNPKDLYGIGGSFKNLNLD